MAWIGYRRTTNLDDRRTASRALRAAFLLVGLLAATTYSAPESLSQFRMFKGPGLRMMPGAFVVPRGRGVVEGEPTGDEAGLKTDPEAKGRLTRANQFVDEGQYNYAAVLWQAVIDESGDSMVETENAKGAFVPIVPMRAFVEATIAQAKPEARAAYRLNADGEVRAMLAKISPRNERETLGKIVRRFFMSSLGDDVAYRLGGLALDRGDFLTAIHMFSKVVEEHPDPDISRGELSLRLAVATARVGDLKTAREYLAAVDRAAPGAPSRKTLALVERNLERGAPVSGGASSGDWLMTGGGPTRRGAMAAIDLAGQKNLADAAKFEFELVFPALAPTPWGGPAPRGDAVVSRDALIEKWRSKSLRPAGGALLHKGRVYLKTADDLVCLDGENIERGPHWRTAWRNDYKLDAQAAWIAMMRMSNPQMASLYGDRPQSAAEAFLFDDRVHHSLSIIGDTIYSLEGHRRSRLGPDDTRGPEGMGGFAWNAAPRRTRVNWLSAFDARTGKSRWRRDAADETAPPVGDPVSTEPAVDESAAPPPGKPGGAEPDPGVLLPAPGIVGVPMAGTTVGDEPSGGFLAAPVECGGLLLAPVTDGGAIFLCAFSPSDGSTRWRTQLCDEPQSGSSPSTPVGVSVDGQEAYVVGGAGAVFAVDGASGDIRWASRYYRQRKQQSSMAMYGMQQPIEFDGWRDDVAIPLGKHLVVMASDSDRLFAVDRRTGRFLWESPRVSPFGLAAEYFLGASGRRVFVAGPKVVRGYDIPSGRLLWEKEVEVSFGRGCVTDDAVLVPVKDSVLVLDPETGKERSQLGVSLVSGEPVGNLYSDGKRLWTLCANRLYQLARLEDRLDSLQKRIEDGDETALSERARVYARAERWDDALTDLRTQRERWAGKHGAEEAASRLFEMARAIDLPARRPGAALKLAVDAYEIQGPVENGSDQGADRAGEAFEAFATDAIRELQTAPDAQAIPDLWRAGRWSTRAPFHRRVAVALAKLAEGATETPAWLMEPTSSSKASLRALAASTLSRLPPAVGNEPLKSLQGDVSPKVRLAALRGALRMGDQEAVAPLIDLLSAEDAAVRSAAYLTLRVVARADLAFDSGAAAEVRAGQVDAWKKWQEQDLPNSQLALPLKDDDAMRGITLIVNTNRQQLVELNENGRELRRTPTTPGTIACFAFVEGRKVAICNNQNLIQVFDESGKEIAKHHPSAVVQSVHGGADGKIVASSNQTRVVYEIDGKTMRELWQHDTDMPISVRRLEDGATLIATIDGTGSGVNRLIEIDRAGKTRWQAQLSFQPHHIDRADDGSTWVLEQNTNRIHEITATGKERSVFEAPLNRTRVLSFQRLPSGHMLIADGQAVREYDSQKKVVSTYNEQGSQYAYRY